MCLVCSVTGLVDSVRQAAWWCPIFTYWFRLGHQAQNICGITWGESFSRLDFYRSAYQNSFSTTPTYHCRLCILNRYSGTLDPLFSLMCGPHQSDWIPTLDVSARPQLGLLPLCYDASIYPFQGSRGPPHSVARQRKWLMGGVVLANSEDRKS